MPSQALSLLLALASLGVPASSGGDSVRHLPVPDQVFDHGFAAWDVAKRRVHVGSWPNIGGGYSQQEHLVLDARTGKRLRTLPSPWSENDVENPGSDSIQAMLQSAEAGFSGLDLLTTNPLDSVRWVSRKTGSFLMGFNGNRCIRIRQAHPVRINVAASCCDPEAEHPVNPCRIPANDWAFWASPDGRTGLLRSQVSQISNDCTGGPSYSIERWSDGSCEHADLPQR